MSGKSQKKPARNKLSLQECFINELQANRSEFPTSSKNFLKEKPDLEEGFSFPGQSFLRKFRKDQKIPVAVLGASGLVGQVFIQLLSDHPFFELVLATATSENEGKKIGDLDLIQKISGLATTEVPQTIKNMPIRKTSLNTIKESGARIIFCALPAGEARTLETKLRQAGFFIFTNASAHRMDRDVPILIPEVSFSQLPLLLIQKKKYGGFIAAGSNCCVAGLSLALKPLMDFGLKRVRVTTFQSISGAGRKGLPALDISGNLIPFIDQEEEKIIRETPKILGFLQQSSIIPQSFEVHPACVRVPILQGHLLDVEIDFQRVPTLNDVQEALGQQQGLVRLRLPSAPQRALILRFEPDRPQPASDLWAGHPQRARGMAVSLGRVRQLNNTVRFFLLTNNLIRGAAGNCLLAAELALALGYLT